MDSEKKPLCEPCVDKYVNGRHRFSSHGLGCHGCGLALLTPAMRELNAAMVRQGIRSASSPPLAVEQLLRKRKNGEP
jgi:hypothetical protein